MSAGRVKAMAEVLRFFLLLIILILIPLLPVPTESRIRIRITSRRRRRAHLDTAPELQPSRHFGT